MAAAPARHDDHQINDPNSSMVSISRIVSVHPKLISVQPAESERVLNLSNLDRQCPNHMHLVFFYNNIDCLSLNSVFSSLKSGLEETLTLWYPGAGRLSKNYQSGDDGKLNLWCNNQGAVLAEAQTPTKISHLGDLSQDNEFFEKLVYKPPFDGNFSNMPLIAAQVRNIYTKDWNFNYTCVCVTCNISSINHKKIGRKKT